MSSTVFALATPLPQLARYYPLRAALEPALAAASLLEVNPEEAGVGALTQAPFVGAMDGGDAPAAGPMRPVRYRGALLPFKSGAFHTVLSLNAATTVPPQDWLAHLHELTRVAASRVVVAFPRPVAAGPGLQEVLALLAVEGAGTIGEGMPEGFPGPEALEATLDDLAGWHWRPLPVVGDLTMTLAVLAEVFPPVNQQLRAAGATSPEGLAQWLKAGSFGPSSQAVYLLERDVPGAAFVGLAAPESLVAALACPDCGADLVAGDRGQVACLGCQRPFSPDAGGVLALTPLRRTVPGPVVFRFKPDWEDPRWRHVLVAFAEAFEAESPVMLWLENDPNTVPSELIVGWLMDALAGLAERELPPIELATSPDEALPPGREVPVTIDALGWSVARFRAAYQHAQT